MERVRENSSNSLSPSPADRPLQRSKVFREPCQHFEDGILVVQANIAPHGGVRGGETREISEAGSGIFDDFRLGYRLQIIRRADDVVGDDVRQMRDDRQNLVVVFGIHFIDARTERPPEILEPFQRLRIRARQRREDAPALAEKTGKPASGPDFSVPASGWPGMKCTLSGICGAICAMTEALVEPTSVTMAPGFRCGAICSATAPDEPTGTETMTRSASLTACAADVVYSLPSASSSARFSVSALRVEIVTCRARPSSLMSRAIDEPIRPMPTSAMRSNMISPITPAP